MSCNLIWVEQGHKVARPITCVEEYRQLRNSSEQLANLRQVREGNEAAKRRLIQFNYSGYYPDGIVKGCKLPSRAFGFDLDDPEAFEEAADQLLAEPEKYGLLMLERSARQGGHAVFRREMGRTILENQVRMATLLGCEMDTSAHDINRVYFSTSAAPEDLLFVSPELFTDVYDPAWAEAEAMALQEREAHGREELPEGAHRGNKHFKPYKLVEVAFPATTEVPTSQPAMATQPLETQLTYLGIPYNEIIRKWWEMYNDGCEPVESNRDTLTFELAVNLRHICGFDRERMAQVIPCYDGFPEAQKMKCIDSALNDRRTQMPKRLKEVLSALRQERLRDDQNAASAADVQTLDEILIEDDLFYFKRLPTMPMGVKESSDAVGPSMSMPVLEIVCALVGGLASGVQLDVHGKMGWLSLIVYLVGEFASNKGSVDPIIYAWLREVIQADQLYLMQEAEWRAKKRAAKNKKDQPEEPKLPVRFLTLNNTVANLAERLANTEGKHAFSFTPEADTVAQKWKSAMSDFSIMLRQAYDGSRYEREARSVEAVNVHIEHLLWNVVMCGTPDALYRVVDNYTDGFQSRIAIARTPDNTFAPLEDSPYQLTDRRREIIGQVAHLLPLMSGQVILPKLEERSRAWVERVRQDAMRNDDKVMARQRFRVCVTAQRMTCCLMLCKVCEQLIRKYGVQGAETRLKQSPDLWKQLLMKVQKGPLLEAYDVLADSLLENALFYFRDRITKAVSSRNYQGSMGEGRSKRGRNDSIYARLDTDFTFKQAMQHSMAVKGELVTQNGVQQMLKNWRKQGLIDKLDALHFRKIGH